MIVSTNVGAGSSAIGRNSRGRGNLRICAGMSIFHDEVEIEDFEYNEETETYSYPCPCGDIFTITRVRSVAPPISNNNKC